MESKTPIASLFPAVFCPDVSFYALRPAWIFPRQAAFRQAEPRKHSVSKALWDDSLSLGKLGRAAGCLEAVLREFLSCFSLIFRAFLTFCFSVIRCADHKKRPFFIQRQADETHHLLPQTTPLVYCTSLLHKCP